MLHGATNFRVFLRVIFNLASNAIFFSQGKSLSKTKVNTPKETPLEYNWGLKYALKSTFLPP